METCSSSVCGNDKTSLPCNVADSSIFYAAAAGNCDVREEVEKRSLLSFSLSLSRFTTTTFLWFLGPR